MSNITLSIDDKIIKKVRKTALEKNTTLTAIVRDFLKGVAASEEQEKKSAAYNLTRTFAVHSRDMGEHCWTRDDLHERN